MSLITCILFDVRIGGTQVISEKFFDGYGTSQVPTNTQWKTALIFNLSNLVNDGYFFSINGNTVTVYNLSCKNGTVSNTLQINVGINIDINCS